MFQSYRAQEAQARKSKSEKPPDSTRFNARQEHGGVAVTKVAYARITHDKKQRESGVLMAQAAAPGMGWNARYRHAHIPTAVETHAAENIKYASPQNRCEL